MTMVHRSVYEMNDKLESQAHIGPYIHESQVAIAYV